MKSTTINNIVPVALILLCGCVATRSDVDSGYHALRKEIRDKYIQVDGTARETEVIEESFAKGPVYSVQGQNLDIGETEVSATTGVSAARSKLEAVFKPLKDQPWLIWIGAGVMIASVLAVWLTKSWFLGVAGSALGVCLIGLAFYPIIAGIAAAAVVVGIGVYSVVMIRREIRDRSALEKIVQAVDEYEKAVPMSEIAKLHTLLGRKMDEADKKVVSQIKHG